MQYLVFSNPGEIDVRLITTLGVNIKPESPSPIGFFGTGLKYAIAVALRSGISVTIQSGLSSFTFSTLKETIRGKEISLITMAKDNGASQTLGFTTDLGKNWELWMAYREFLCNSLDESGGKGLTTSQPPNPSAGTTTVILSGEAILSVHQQRAKYFLESSPILSEENLLEVHHPVENAVFYRGIRVFQTKARFLFSYNLLFSCKLTEDRTLVDAQWLLTSNLARFTAKCHDTAFIKMIVSAKKDVFESSLDFDFVYFEPSPEFLSVVGELFETDILKTNQSAIRLYQKYTTPKEPKTITLTRVEQKQLEKALAFLARLNHYVSEPIFPVETLGETVMGLAQDGRILIPRACFAKGTKYLAATLLEEHLHLSMGFLDCDRGMQNWLFERLMSLGEELLGEPL